MTFLKQDLSEGSSLQRVTPFRKDRHETARGAPQGFVKGPQGVLCRKAPPLPPLSQEPVCFLWASAFHSTSALRGLKAEVFPVSFFLVLQTTDGTYSSATQFSQLLLTSGIAGGVSNLGMRISKDFQVDCYQTLPSEACSVCRLCTSHLCHSRVPQDSPNFHLFIFTLTTFSPTRSRGVKANMGFPFNLC